MWLPGIALKIIEMFNKPMIYKQMLSKPILPKVELHCHLDGILDSAMLRAILVEDPAFPVNPDDFEQFYPITNIDTFFNWWGSIEAISGELGYLYPVMAHHVNRLKNPRCCLYGNHDCIRRHAR